MRKSVACIGLVGTALLMSGCAHRGLGRQGPNEFAVARQAPLVIPPDYSLVPPAPGAARANADSASQQALETLFGGPAARSTVESNALQQAGQGTDTDEGVRSQAGDAQTKVFDKGTTTRDIVAAPAGNGQDASVTAGGTTSGQ